MLNRKFFAESWARIAPSAFAILLDVIEAESSMGFHADQEAIARVGAVARRNPPRAGGAADSKATAGASRQ